MKTSEFDYELPPELIAQEPLPDRSQSRMMVVHRDSQELEHRVFSDLPVFLRRGDVLVVNDTRVMPARILGQRSDTGGRVELLLVEEVRERPGAPPAGDEPGPWSACWDAFYRASGRARPGLRFSLAKGKLSGEVLKVGKEGRTTVRLSGNAPLSHVLAEEGFAPVPPYIKRPPGRARLAELDRERYQTVYAAHEGAIAAPTAGLHFTEALLGRLAGQGVCRAAVTLHVGPGTFKPVKSDLVSGHDMEGERYTVSAEAARTVSAARSAGGRVLAVGSTTVRALESAAEPDGTLVAGQGRTSLFIHPPYEFRAVDAIVTNFHLPKSTLIMMMCAFAGRNLVLRAYHEAVSRGYRFYSYGDCMLIV